MEAVTKRRSRFGTLLRQHRVAAALSQEALAERAGLSVRGLSDLERGVHRAPRLETVRVLADALGLGEIARGELLAMARPEPGDQMPTGQHAPLVLDPLPLPPMRLIGREADVATICELLSTHDGRLVTLTGAGGTGKTSLGLEVARTMRKHFRDGVCLVDLSALTDPSLVVPVMATTLGVREQPNEPLVESLCRQLQDRHLLVVLDNVERVLPAASDVADLLTRCAHLIVLATSRIPLRIRAEREVAVPPLSLPEPGQLPPLVALEQIAAIALFVERARASRSDFTLTGSNAHAVVGICRRLDGLPLAIELAASRIKVLSPPALLTRLEQRLPLLTGGGRDLPARQRTMRGAIAWSYELLTADEQELFRRQAVFAGGFTMNAAEAASGQDGALDVFASLVALVDGSLLRQEDGHGAEPRFRMLETVREFGLELLAEQGELEEARARHGAYFLHLMDQRLEDSADFITPLIVNLERLGGLATEHDNLHLALTWFEQHGDAEALLRLTAALYGLWLLQGPYREGLRWLGRALEMLEPDLVPSQQVVPATRVQALSAATRLATFLGEYDRAQAFITQGLSLARGLDTPLLLVQALNNAGFLAYRRGEYDHAEAQLGEAHHLLITVVDTVDGVSSDAYMPTLLLGDTAMARGQFDQASAWYGKVLEVPSTAQWLWSPIDARAGQAAACYCLGNLSHAVTLYLESLARAQELDIALLVATSFVGLAAVAADVVHPEEGARLIGAAEGIWAILGTPMFPRDRPVYERALASLAAALGQEQLTALLSQGRALVIEDAVAEAIAVGESALRGGLPVHD